MIRDAKADSIIASSLVDLGKLFLLIVFIVASFILVSGVAYYDFMPELLAIITGFVITIALIWWSLRSPYHPAFILLAIGPFQAILTVYFGLTANIVTVFICLMFIFQIPKTHLILVLTATRIQRLMLIFIFFLLLSSFQTLSYEYTVENMIVDALQKVTLVLVVTVFVVAFQVGSSKTIMLLSTFVTSMGLYSILSIIDFYFGISFLPDKGYFGSKGLFGTLSSESIDLIRIDNYRLPGISNTMSINQFAFWSGVSFFLCLGLIFSQLSKRQLFIMFGMMAILIISVVASGSRGVILGVAVGLAVFLIRERISFSFLTGAIITLVCILGLFYLKVIPSEIIVSRFSSSELTQNERSPSWNFAIELFMQSPIFGVGIGGFSSNFLKTIDSVSSAADAHSAYLDLLSERGLISFIPFTILVLYTAISLFRTSPFMRYQIPPINIKASKQNNARDLPTPVGFFLNYKMQSACFSAFIMILIVCLFNSYQFERITWLLIAIAASLDSESRLKKLLASNHTM